jgi:predicted nucleic acid-binding protein
VKVCFDSNVVIDIALKDRWFAHSYAAYDVAALRRFDTYLSASAVSDIVYVLHRRGLARRESTDMLPLLFGLFDIFDVSAVDCGRAYESGMADYEDALLAFAAQRNGIDLIVTRNTKDFVKSPVKAISPKEFAAMFTPDGYEYDSLVLAEDGEGAN